MNQADIVRLRNAVNGDLPVIWKKEDHPQREVYFVGSTSKFNSDVVAGCHEGGFIQIDQDHSTLEDFKILTPIP